MSRKIKFRIWDKVDNEFKSFMDGDFVSGQFYSPYPIEEFVIQQWTGLFDKNEVEIYEGDILKLSNDGKFTPDLIDETWKEGEEYVVSIVRSRMGEYYGQNTKTSWYSLLDYENWKVVGNIFENPELI